MNLLDRPKTYLIAISMLAAVLLFFACSGPSAESAYPYAPDESAAPYGITTAPSDNASVLTQDDLSILPDRVDVVYFHRPQRCPTCLCFEERVRYVVSTYFRKEMDSGQMTFGVYNIGESQNADIVNKYGAIASQLFINTVKDGKDNIKDIQDIWSWNCRTNKAGFDQKVKNVIEQSLKGEN
jgi:hypothetical protein